MSESKPDQEVQVPTKTTEVKQTPDEPAQSLQTSSEKQMQANAQAPFGYRAIDIPQSVPVPSLETETSAAASSRADLPAIPGLDLNRSFSPVTAFADFQLPRGAPIPGFQQSQYSSIQQHPGSSITGLSQYTLSDRPQPASANSPASTYVSSPSVSTSFRFDSPDTSLSSTSSFSPNQSYDHFFYSGNIAERQQSPVLQQEQQWPSSMIHNQAGNASGSSSANHYQPGFTWPTGDWQHSIPLRPVQRHDPTPDPLFRDQAINYESLAANYHAPRQISPLPNRNSASQTNHYTQLHNYAYPRAPHPQSLPQYQANNSSTLYLDQFLNLGSSASTASPLVSAEFQRREVLNQFLTMPNGGASSGYPAQPEIKVKPKRKRTDSEVAAKVEDEGDQEPAFQQDDFLPDVASAFKRQRTESTPASLSPTLTQHGNLHPAISSMNMNGIPMPGSSAAGQLEVKEEASEEAEDDDAQLVESYINVVPGNDEGLKETFLCRADGCKKRVYKTRNGIKGHVMSCHVNEGTYECSFAGCDEKFGSKRDKSTHERTHTNQKPSKASSSSTREKVFCPCGKAYILPVPFANHMRTCETALDAAAKALTDGPQAGSSQSEDDGGQGV